MKRKLFALVLLTATVAWSCGPDLDFRPRKRSRKIKDDDVPAPVTSGFVNGSYQLILPDQFDPLWRFSKQGNSVTLETNPSIGVWGSDYFGYWSDPYSISDNEISYTIGLTHTTYTFVPFPDGTVDVTRTLVVQPYLGNNPPTTTITHVGVFATE